MSDKRDTSQYVRHVQESTQQYTRDVLNENERLGALVMALNDDKARLMKSVALLEERVKDQQQTESSLLGRLAAMNETTRTFTARCLEVEQLNSNLANLYVASYRIHGSLEREDVLSTLQEILINLIGTEEFAVFEREGDGALLRCASSFGVPSERLHPLRMGEGSVGAAIASGAPYVAPSDPDPTRSPAPVAACIPLRVGERVVGAIVVYRLLAHKPALEEADVELLNLLATHGAMALYCSTLHSRRAREACA